MDNRAEGREAKLGCVFTQTRWDEEGYPIRELDSTNLLEACKRGWSRAETKVVIGDGAE
jgi:hypothetical protein